MSDNTLGLSDIADGACEYPVLAAMSDNPRLGFRALAARTGLGLDGMVLAGSPSALPGTSVYSGFARLRLRWVLGTLEPSFYTLLLRHSKRS